ncbi:MAG TPA: AIR synthase-related protein, partial [Nevskiaceae bacterium]|nr:AIR synthase-related protein [Nevskiaceae bacterium]
FPKGCGAVVDASSWKRPAIFDWLQRFGLVSDEEMWRVFNCGVGFAIVVPRVQVDKALALLRKSKLKPWVLGEIVKGKQDVRFV